MPYDLNSMSTYIDALMAEQDEANEIRMEEIYEDLVLDDDEDGDVA